LDRKNAETFAFAFDFERANSSPSSTTPTGRNFEVASKTHHAQVKI
jgi:hypothetical protein